MYFIKFPLVVSRRTDWRKLGMQPEAGHHLEKYFLVLWLKLTKTLFELALGIAGSRRANKVIGSLSIAWLLVFSFHYVLYFLIVQINFVHMARLVVAGNLKMMFPIVLIQKWKRPSPSQESYIKFHECTLTCSGWNSCPSCGRCAGHCNCSGHRDVLTLMDWGKDTFFKEEGTESG